MYILYLFIMLDIDMLSIILHDTCIHYSNVCEIDRNACILLFNLYMQCHYMAFLYYYIKQKPVSQSFNEHVKLYRIFI